MLFLLRNIRRKLLGSKVSSYLLYAIGEIVLVVVGILIAISIDDWSQYKKDRLKETKILLEMKANLELDFKRLGVNIQFLDSCIYSNQQVLAHLNGDPVNEDSLTIYYNRLFAGTYFGATINDVAYQNLLSAGLDFIENDSLRKEISELYTITYTEIESTEEHFDQKILLERLSPALLNNIETLEGINWTGKSYPINYEELKENKTFKEVIILHLTSKGYLFQLYINAQPKLESLIEHIQYDLTNRLNYK